MLKYYFKFKLFKAHTIVKKKENLFQNNLSIFIFWEHEN